MFWRRYIEGLHPILVWADDEDAADIVAVAHHVALIRDADSCLDWEWQVAGSDE